MMDVLKCLSKARNAILQQNRVVSASTTSNLEVVGVQPTDPNHQLDGIEAKLAELAVRTNCLEQKISRNERLVSQIITLIERYGGVVEGMVHAIHQLSVKVDFATQEGLIHVKIEPEI